MTTKDNDSFYSFTKNVVQGCCLKEARQQRQRFFLTKKMLSFVVVRNSTTTKTTKDNYSLFSSLKMLSKVVLRCRLSMGVKFLLGLDAELMRFYILACRNGVYRHDKNKQRYFFIFVMDIFLFQWTKVLLKHPVQTAIQKIIC